MHERERHRIITSAVQERPVVTVQDLVELTSASEATIRRDIAALALQGRLRKVRGGAEALQPPRVGTLAGRPFHVNEGVNSPQKRAIAREAAALCQSDGAIIINGGTTTFQMVHYLAGHRLQVFTNSFPIAEHLLKHSKNTVMVPSGTIYREQNIILSPFEQDGSNHINARRAFIGAQGVGPLGVMESDGLVIQSVQRLVRQAEELVLLVDATKFDTRSSLILCPLDHISTLITDDRISDVHARMVENAGIRLIVAAPAREEAGRTATYAPAG